MIKSVNVFDNEVLIVGNKINCKCKANIEDVEFIIDMDLIIRKCNDNVINCEAFDGIGFNGCKDVDVYIDDVLSGMVVLTLFV